MKCIYKIDTVNSRQKSKVRFRTKEMAVSIPLLRLISVFVVLAMSVLCFVDKF